MRNKIHAKDYLTDFSIGKPEWLQVLIKETIETNGAISEDRKNEIFENLLNNTQLHLQSAPITRGQQKTDKLLFDSLTHKSGVNALSENQTIKFSPDITVLYGLNGSGKSSYFRILNNVSGGTQHKSILPNIYVDDANTKPINISIKYKIGNTLKNHICTGSITEQPDFHGVKVFDSSYLSGLLHPKNPDEAVVYPLGLHLFSYLAQIMDSYTGLLSLHINQELQKLPIIKTDDFKDKLKNKFNNRQDFTEQEKTEIKKRFVFSETEKEDLSHKEAKLKLLKQTNYEDKICLVKKENEVFSNFITKINKITSSFEYYYKTLKNALETYASIKTKNDEARKRSEILTKLPKSDSQEWKSFIKAGQEYSSKLEKVEPAVCPYCHQEIKSEEAINILKAYTDFLNDTSEHELNKAKQDLDNIRKEIEKIDISISISNEIKTVITNTCDLQNKIDNLSSYKTILCTAHDPITMPTMEVDFLNEIQVLVERQNKNEKTIKELESSNKDKENELRELQKWIAELKEKKSVSEQKTEIEKYFSIYDHVRNIDLKKNETKTTSLTKIATLAQNELLTDSLKQKFETELKLLGKDNLKVILEVSRGSKGKCLTQLKLIGKHSVNDILSEGEQKAVGLAMFFAEIPDENYPIILDDPVTSLDHEIASMVAQRLLNFNNQVIVFCHNRLFLDGFETSKKNHVCKNFDSCSCTPDKGKHIYIYQVYGDGKEKGILSNYRGDNSESLIKDADKRLNHRPFTDNYGVSILLRRAVEKIIDEEVFKHQLPPRVSNKNSRINWEDLKKINSRPDLVDRLKIVHDHASEENHDGTASNENPISIDELRKLLKELSNIKNEFKKSI